MYYLFFYVYSKRSFGFEILRDIFNDKKIKKRIDRDKKYFAFLVGLYISVMWLVFVIGSWDIMIEFGKYNEISENIMINKVWNIIYDSTWIGAYNIGIFDEDNDSYYESIKYDVNRDWKADIIHIDTNWDFEIDEIIYKDYSEKRLPIMIIFLITCIIALIIIIKSWKTLKEVLKEIYKRKMEEEKIGIDIANWWEQINLRSLEKKPEHIWEKVEKEHNTISFNDLIKQKFWKKQNSNDNNTTIKSISIENEFSIEQEQENLNKLTDLLINWVIDNETYETKWKEIKTRIKNLKEKDKDKETDLWKSLKSLIILSIFSISIAWILLKDSVYALQISDISQIKSRHTKCVQDPYNDKNCVWVWLEYRKFFQHLKNPTFKSEFDQWVDKLQKANANPWEKAELTKERNNRWDKWKKINPNDSIYSTSFKYNELFNYKNLNYSWDYNNRNFENEKIIELYSQIPIDSKNLETIDYLNYLDWLQKYEKQLLENSSDLLKNINILNQTDSIKQTYNKQLIINYFDKWLSEYWLKADYLNYINIQNLDSLKNNNFNFSKIEKSIWLNAKEEFPLRMLLSKLWKSINNYQDYQKYSVIPGYSNKNILWMITLTNFIEYNINANPIDVTIELVWHATEYLGYNKTSTYITSFKIWKKYRSILADAYTLPNNTVKKATNYFYNQIIWKTQQIEWWLKTNSVWKIQWIKSYIYWKNVIFFQKYSYKFENWLYLWIEWVKFISKWLCWILK